MEGKIDRECFWVLHLNSQNCIVKKELVAMGTINAAAVAPREVFKGAILRSAKSIVTVHNHPSGHLEPSVEDLRFWDMLSKSGEILGIPVTDHLIIGPVSGQYYSHVEASSPMSGLRA